MTLSEYILCTRQNILSSGENGDIVFDSKTSNAIIVCFNIMNEYARSRNLKSVPIPVAVMSKRSEDTQNYAQIKFNQQLSIDALYSIIDKLGLGECVTINEYSSCISFDIYR